MSIFSSITLLITGLVCALGIFHRAYDDTLLERVGMSCVATWAFLRLAAGDSVAFCYEPEAQLLLYAGLASYSMGSGWAKYRAFTRKNPPLPPSPPTGPGALSEHVKSVV